MNLILNHDKTKVIIGIFSLYIVDGVNYYEYQPLFGRIIGLQIITKLTNFITITEGTRLLIRS